MNAKEFLDHINSLESFEYAVLGVINFPDYGINVVSELFHSGPSARKYFKNLKRKLKQPRYFGFTYEVELIKGDFKRTGSKSTISTGRLKGLKRSTLKVISK